MKLGIDILRHIFCVAVIVQHMSSSRYSATTNEQLRAVIDWIDGAVAGFFFISGYFTSISNSFFVSIAYNIKRLLLPFFIFSVVYLFLLGMLGKMSYEDGLIRTISLRGTGMQLYFLPYLFVVSSVYIAIVRKMKKSSAILFCEISIIALSLICVISETDYSSGSDLRLIPFYSVAFILGTLSRTKCISGHRARFLSLSICFTFFVGILDQRFLDLTGVIILFFIADIGSDYLPKQRLPGSGGVYLLHTPVTNFAISMFFTSLGVVEDWNIVASVLVTYLVCLYIVMLCIKWFPQHKWVILE